jgi:hypothetical protein
MRPWVANCCCTVILITGAVVSGFASPTTFQLLPLVPSGSEVVAGFQNLHDPGTAGRLLLTTHNNRLDLDDWLALAGVDSERSYDEIVEVAASRSGGELNEHLLLVAGHFDGERIYRSLEQNGAKTTYFDALRIIPIEPFAREKGDMLETRWLAILNDRIAMFGTPAIVQKSLERYFNHAVPDPVLIERLAQLRPDLTSWNVLESPPEAARNVYFARTHGAWASLMEDTELLMVGARFGPKIRVDFFVRAATERGEAYFNRKAALFTNIFAQSSSAEGTVAEPHGPRLANLLVEEHRIQASVALSRKQFDEWRDGQIARNIASGQPAPPLTPGESFK